ncbi:MAG: hypothetical protein ACRETB_11800 [Steroidobacteraceae bacterium]
MDQDNPGRRARRTRRGRNGASRRAHAGSASAGADLPDLLGRFSDALSLISVVQRSLAAQESARIGDEEVALGRAIDELKAVYNELDASAATLPSAMATHLAPPSDE